MSYYNIALANENLRQYDEAVANYEKFLRFWLGEPRYKQIAQRKVQQLRQLAPTTP
jgi:hypothetical protein